MNIIELYELFRQYPSVQTDTRKLKKGDLFFALRGPNYNANAFASAALANGAAYAVIDDAAYHTQANTILVDNVLETLQQLALYHRNQFNIPFIAITGSNGKTTTKELIHAVLSRRFKTYTTIGNLNNHIGIPLTLLNIRADAEMAVVEMGANHRGEIAAYCLFTRPDHGLITNVGKAHLEGFGGYEGVKKGKGELYDFLRATDGTAFVMWDYDYLREMSKGIKNVYRYGTHDAELVGTVAGGAIKEAGGAGRSGHTGITIEGESALGREAPALGREAPAPGREAFLSVSVGDTIIRTQLVGAYNLPNVLAAVAVGKYFGVEDDQIREALESYIPGNSRSQLVEQGGNKIVLDAYNANPTSMRAAIENFAGMGEGDKVLILGAMAELGEDSLREHEEIVALIDRYPWKAVALVGGDFLRTDSRWATFPDAEAARSWLQQQSYTNTFILVKGSRSMQMERVVE